MNKNQKIVIVTAVAVIAIMALFPPRILYMSSGVEGGGYHFIFRDVRQGDLVYGFIIDKGTLLIQISIALLIASGLFFVAKK